MKKLFTLIIALFALTAIQAQFSFTPVQKQLAPGQKINFGSSNNLRSGATSITINYDSADRYVAGQTAGDTVFPTDASGYLYTYAINGAYDTSYYYNVNYAIVTFDTLVDVNNHFAGLPYAGNTVRVDSLIILLADSNGSGSADSFTVSVFDKTAATTTGTGLTEAIVTTPLWSKTYGGTSNIFGPGSGQYIFNVPFYPNVTLPAGHVFGVRVDYKGDVNNSFAIAASNSNSCGNYTGGYGLASPNPIAPHNSSFFFDYGQLSGVYDWNANTPVAPATSFAPCDLWPVQNFYIFPSVTVTPAATCPAITVTATEIGNTKSADASASGGVAPYTFAWSGGTASSTTDTATGLTNGSTYTVTATDHNGCTGTATVSISTGIESIDAGVTNFSVFPNPSNGLFTANVSLVAASDVTITVTDMTGSKIFESTDKAVKEINKQINLSSIATGIYFVSVKTAQGTANQRIVIK
jgi:hypothetical protein